MNNDPSNVEISVNELKLLVNTLSKSVALSLKRRFAWLWLLAGLLIGVGVTQALDAAGQRMLSLCKNKLGYVKPSFPVQLDVFRSKMK